MAQVAAYAAMYEEVYAEPIDLITIDRVGKEADDEGDHYTLSEAEEKIINLKDVNGFPVKVGDIAKVEVAAIDVGVVVFVAECLLEVCHHAGLADARFTAEKGDGARHDPAAEHAIEFCSAARDAVLFTQFHFRQTLQLAFAGQRSEPVGAGGHAFGYRFDERVPCRAMRALALPLHGLSPAFGTGVDRLGFSHRARPGRNRCRSAGARQCAGGAPAAGRPWWCDARSSACSRRRTRSCRFSNSMTHNVVVTAKRPICRRSCSSTAPSAS